MRVLIGYASKHGGTREIAERIAARIQAPSIEVEVRAVQEHPDLGRFDAFVIGSSIYYGRWSRDAVAFVRRNGAELSARPVWLFSSGPVGEQASVDPAELEDLMTATAACDHALFRGAVKTDQLTFTERLLARAMKVSGDYRDWPAIEAWASAIRTELSAGVAPPARCPTRSAAS